MGWGKPINKNNPWRKFSLINHPQPSSPVSQARRDFSFNNKGRQISDSLGTNRLRPKHVMDNERLVCA